MFRPVFRFPAAASFFFSACAASLWLWACHGRKCRSRKDGWLLVPLSGKFAFISPTKLIIAGPLLALIPILPFLFTREAFHLRRVPVWSGGRREDSRRIATTSLSFSNALRTFYSFIYGPTHNLQRVRPRTLIVRRLIFN